MKIAYTYHGMTQRVGGVSRYLYENFIRIGKVEELKIFSHYNENLYFSQIYPQRTYHIGRLGIRGANRLRRLIEDVSLYVKLKTSAFDVLHHTGEADNVFSWTKKPIVITIHDMIPEMYYKSATHRIKMRKNIIHKATAIICVSQNTKDDLLRIYPDVDADKIFVIYHGSNTTSFSYRPLIKDDYILFVGSRFSQYKNFSTFLQGVAPLVIGRNLKIVCTGSPFSKEELQMIDSLRLNDSVLNVGFVDDNELMSLYHYARCFVYPSMYEGFGIPILEAFSAQCPTCLSDASCFPEIAQDAAAYFDPKDEKTIRQSVMKVLDDDNYRQQLINKGIERMKAFSWDEAAKKTLEVYKFAYNDSKKQHNKMNDITHNSLATDGTNALGKMGGVNRNPLTTCRIYRVNTCRHARLQRLSTELRRCA